MKGKMFILTLSLAALFMMPAGAQSLSSGKKEKQPPIVMGKEIVRDSVKASRNLKTYEIAPKGEWQVGLQGMYLNLSSDNSEYMLLLSGIDAKASMFRVTPLVSYTYMTNQSVGLKLQYTQIDGMVDAATLDLLNDGLSFGVNNVNAHMRTFSAAVYHRSYIGLDNRGRVGLIYDFTLGYSRGRSVMGIGDPGDSYSLNNQFKLTFSPGFVFFAMDNVSAHVTLSVADLSYNNVRAYSGGSLSGTRDFWRAQLKLNALDLNFGLAFHF